MNKPTSLFLASIYLGVMAAGASERALYAGFDKTLEPVLLKYCIDCHGPDKQESDLRLDTLTASMQDHDIAETWADVLDALDSGEMPPKKAKQHPPQDERDRAIAWLELALDAAKAEAASDSQHVGLRRLNRAEYAHSIRDLLGVRFDPEKAGFPIDSVAEGFDTLGEELVVSPALLEKYLASAKWVTRKAIADGKPLLSAPAGKGNARQLIRGFAERAFRRPVAPEKLDRLMELAGRKRGQTGIQLAVEAVLCSPQFIYMIEAPGPLDDHALATRLSYFLWSSLPDDELRKLADAGTLNAPAVLEAQTLRLLKDPRSKAFVQRFAGQWLGLHDIGIMQPDKAVFPDYDEALEDAMRRESELFFADILENDRSILTFLDSDFTMLNDRLARHYGIAGVKGPSFRRVSLQPKDRRGGVLGQASVLSITSDGVRSSPVMRGVWILNNLLGDPPEPPPDDVPDLEPDTRGTVTKRQELAQHRSVESCNSCHRKIDPLGFALENYNAIGQWRTQYPREDKTAQRIPVDPAGRLANGPKFGSFAEFKRQLMGEGDTFSRCLSEKLLTYAIGRRLDFGDEKAVDELVDALPKSKHGFRSLIIRVVQSGPFRNK